MAQELIGQLRTIGAEMRLWADRGESVEIAEPLQCLERAAEETGKAWSGSFLGYHTRVYYQNFKVPPPGDHFSPEWGLQGVFQGSTGGWREYQRDDVLGYIALRADEPNLSRPREASTEARKAFTDAKSDVISVLSAFLGQRDDEFLQKLKVEAEEIIALSKSDGIRVQMPHNTSFTSRDSLAMHQGIQAAPHQEIFAEVVALRSPFSACGALGKVASRAAAHIERLVGVRTGMQKRQGDNVFIGHGRAQLWRELKDFIQDRLHLPWEEFNRVPVAGLATVASTARRKYHLV